MNNNDLANLFARLNNLIMNGSFSGDVIDEASYLKGICFKMYNELKEEPKEERVNPHLGSKFDDFVKELENEKEEEDKS